MKIRSQVDALLTASVVVLTLVCGWAVSIARDAEHVQVQISAVEALIRSTAELRQIAMETDLFHEPRARDQWHRKISAMLAELDHMPTGSLTDITDIDRIRQYIVTAKTVYARLPPLSATSAGAADFRPFPADSGLEARAIASLLTSEISDVAYDMVGRKRMELAKSWNGMRIAAASIAMTMSIVIFLAWNLIRRRILMPLRKIEHGALMIATGDYSQRLSLARDNEIGQLASAFDAMADQVQQARIFQDEFNATLTRSIAATEAALREKNALLTTLNMHAIVSVADRAGLITDVNMAFCDISGYSRAELMGSSHNIVNSGVHARGFWVDMWRTISKGTPWRGEVCNRARDGSLYWVDTFIAPFMGMDGKVGKYISIRTDISSRKRSEIRVIETSSLLHSVLESASEVSIIATDPELRIRVFNSGAQRLLGYTSDEMVGRETLVRVHDTGELRARGEELSAQFGRIITDGNALIEPATLRQPREWTYLHKDGGRITVSLVMTAMKSDDGRLLGYLGVAHDVTRQKQLESSLRSAMHKARKASLAKSMFLANMSHEIRTPMNAVMGLTYLLGKTHLSDEQAGFLAKIHIASKSLLAIINDVLDLSRIEAGELTVEKTPFDMFAVLKDLSDLISVQTESKGLAFVVDIADDLPAVIEGDGARLGQILTNLLGNAVKFTEQGEITLGVRSVAISDHDVTLRFVVRDSGIGIPLEAQEKIFAPFVQADDSTTRRFGGSGLGLSIVSRLVALMGGNLGMSSTAGVGSEFWAELSFGTSARVVPDMPCRNPAIPDNGEDIPDGARVLIVDDSDINLEVAGRILTQAGFRVSTAADGLEAIECLRAASMAFDIVLMDVQMPKLDGIEATRRIRDDLGMRLMPVIAVTAGVLTSEHAQTREAGMNGFISKPFDAEELIRTVHRHVRSARQSAFNLPTAKPIMQVPRRWPEIEGINGSAASARLGGDVHLFQSMLKRLCNEFCDIGMPPDESDPAALTVLAARLHKLKGSAGLLGAGMIRDLAGQGEQACRVGEFVQAGQTVALLAAAVARLRHAISGAAAMKLAPDTGPDIEVTGTLDPEKLAELRSLLCQNNLLALQRFSELTPHLRTLLGHEAFARLCEQVDNLEFSEAGNELLRLGGR